MMKSINDETIPRGTIIIHRSRNLESREAIFHEKDKKRVPAE